MIRDAFPHKRAIPVLAAIVSSLFIAGCRRSTVPEVPTPPAVRVVESRRLSVPVLVTPNATTRALEDVTIRARVRGFLAERHFEEGSLVKKGQLLLVIDEEPYKVALRSARARQAEAEAALKKAEESKDREVKSAQMALDRALLVLAELQERRSGALLRRNAATREEMDKSEADRKKYEAQVQADLASLDQAKADYVVGIASTSAQVEATKAAVRDAELNLGYCRMYAAITGRLGEAKVKVGNLVGPDSGGGGTFSELATIQQLEPMGVDIRISSRYLDRITRLVRQNLAVRLMRPGVEGDREHPFEGTCYFVDNHIDETTSTFLAKVRIPNPDGTLLPGEYVKLKMIIDRIEDAVVVPAPSVTETEAGPIVYVVDGDGKVAIRRIEAAQTYEGLRVITRGLEAGQAVIVEGLQMIRPGIAVTVEPASRLAARIGDRD